MGRRDGRRGNRTPGGALSLAQQWAALPGLLADWDPSVSASVTKDGSDLVSSFASTVGGYTVVQATAASQPLWVSNGLNGYPSIRYDGVADNLAGALGLAGAIDGSAPYSVYFVGALTAAGGVAKTPWSIGSTANNTNWVQTVTEAATDRFRYARQDGVVVVNEGVGVFTTALFDCVEAYSGTAISGYLNGVATLTASANVRAPTCNSVSMGCLMAQVPVSFWGGDIGRFLVYDRVHSDAERALVRSYIRSRYT